MIKIGSLFAGIGGFELGLERAIPNSETIWQVEQDKFCQRVLRKHWPQSKIYNDVREVSSHNLEPVDLLCGGFPCQDISIAGKGEGLDGKKSGLWWEMHRIIRDIRPRVIVLENVPAITFRGGLSVIGSLTKLGYSCEWGIISARQFGAPHLRKRWFCVAYSHSSSSWQMRNRQNQNKSSEGYKSEVLYKKRKTYTERTTETDRLGDATYPESANTSKRNTSSKCLEKARERKTRIEYNNSKKDESHKRTSYWIEHEAPSPICRVDDGISDRVAKLRALGNAIVPQCSEYIGRLIHESGVLYG